MTAAKAKPKMPDHVKAAIEQRTGAPVDARRARPTLCPSCRRWTLTGLDGDVMAITAVCDPVPLSPTGEYAAVLAGWRTWELRAERSASGTWKTQLTPRSASRRAWWPAGGPPRTPGAPYDVLVAHHHVEPFSGPLAAASRLQPPSSTSTATDQPPPF